MAELLERLGRVAGRDPTALDPGRLFHQPATGGALATAQVAIGAWLAEALAAGRALRDDLPAPLQARLTLAVLRAMDEWSVHHPDDAAELIGVQLETLRRLLAP